MPSLFKLLLALVVTGGSLIGCGGDDDSAKVAADAHASADLGNVADDLAAFGSEECLAASAAFLGAAGAAGTAFSGAGDDLDQSVKKLQQFADAAPNEIKADFKIVAEGYAEIVKAIADVNFDASSGDAPNAEQMAALEEMGKKFEDSDFKDASDRITAWFEENCGGGK